MGIQYLMTAFRCTTLSITLKLTCVDTMHNTTKTDFTFTLPCIVTDFLLNNHPNALIIPIYSVIKLYMFRASSLPTIRSFLLYIQHW